MNRIATLLLLLVPAFGFATGIEFYHGTWDEALARAQAEEKLIFVDAYASWCGPCKRMAKNVFPQQEVGDFFNNNFIAMKYDMEKPESKDFRKTHSVRAYPTLLFINGKNEVVAQAVGGKSADQLIAAGQMALAKMDNVETLGVKYEEGDRNPDFMFKYLRALVRDPEQNHLRVANEYFRKPTGNITDEYNLKSLIAVTTESDSRLFDLLIDNRSAAVALVGQDAYDATVKRAIQNSFDKAVEFEDRNLLDATVDKQTAIDKTKGKQLGYQGEYELALRGTSASDFAKATKNYLKKGAAGDAERLRYVFASATGSKFTSDEKVIELIKESVELSSPLVEDAWRDYYRLATFLHKQKLDRSALEAAQKSLEGLPEDAANYRRAVTNLIEQIQAG